MSKINNSFPICMNLFQLYVAMASMLSQVNAFSFHYYMQCIGECQIPSFCIASLRPFRLWLIRLLSETLQ